MRVAIYARYSDDRQNERSVDDQITVLTRHSVARGWTVLCAYTDAAISGAHMVNRPGLNAALAACEAGEFDMLLAEDEDRIARSLEHLAHVKNRLEYAGGRLATLTTDQVDDMRVAFKGLAASDFLRNLSQKTKRGMNSNAEKGLATGSRLYGYTGAAGGAVVINQEQAAIVRRIFAEYADGRTPRAIAEGLNHDRLPSPHGNEWNASTINGSRQRANGILNTELYAGVKVWNRLKTWKDPRSGKKLSKPRPAEEWQRTPVPHLRIVDEQAWQAVRARKVAEGSARPPQLVRKRPGVFSGLIRCGVCGGAYTAGSGGRLICTVRRERGPSACSNRRTVPRIQIEQRVLTALRERLLAPEAVEIYVRRYHQRWQANRLLELSQRAPLEKRLAEIERRIDRGVAAIFDGSASDKIKDTLKALDLEKVEVAARLAAMGAVSPPIELHPRLAQHYSDRVRELQECLAEAATDDGKRKLVEAARDLVDKITVRPVSDDRAADLEIVLHGRLAPFLRPVGASLDHQPDCTGQVVAGGGYMHSCTWEQPEHVALRA